MERYDKAKTLKKFDTIECIDGLKTVNFLDIHTGSNILIIHYMDKTRTFALQNEMIKYKRYFKPVVHRNFIHDINHFVI